MILSRAPLRLSLGGGGTDIPSHYKEEGGEWFSLAINKYIFTSLNLRFSEKALIRYSINEEIQNPKNTKNKILAEIFKKYCLPKNIEFTSISDIHAGTGLGSSGAFIVSSLNTVRAFLNLSSSRKELAIEATEIEIDKLGRPSGLQDQFISSYGGLRHFTVSTEGEVKSSGISLPNEINHFFDKHVALIYTKQSRESSSVLSEFSRNLKKNKISNSVNEEYVPKFSSYSESLIKLDYIELGNLLNIYWQIKKNQTSNMTNKYIDNLYECLKGKGMIGGKIVGAGGGGFILAIAEDLKLIKDFCVQKKIRFLQVYPDYDGARVLHRI